MEIIHGDRRSHRRYQVALELVFETPHHRGYGMTRDMSSSGVLFAGDTRLPPGTRVRLSIDWPFKLQNVCPLKLDLEGVVVRSEAREMAVRTSRYEFRSCRFSEDPPEKKRLIAVF